MAYRGVGAARRMTVTRLRHATDWLWSRARFYAGQEAMLAMDPLAEFLG
jgi:hypothetical protein